MMGSNLMQALQQRQQPGMMGQGMGAGAPGGAPVGPSPFTPSAPAQPSPMQMGGQGSGLMSNLGQVLGQRQRTQGAGNMGALAGQAGAAYGGAMGGPPGAMAGQLAGNFAGQQGGGLWDKLPDNIKTLFGL